MYKICFYVPTSHVEEVKNAMFDAGAGTIGDYSRCAWQVLGEGQFLPLQDSNAYIGKEGELEKVEEYKVEMVCSKDLIQEAVNALKSSHPYEVVPYQVTKIEDVI